MHLRLKQQSCGEPPSSISALRSLYVSSQCRLVAKDPMYEALCQGCLGRCSRCRLVFAKPCLFKYNYTYKCNATGTAAKTCKKRQHQCKRQRKGTTQGNRPSSQMPEMMPVEMMPPPLVSMSCSKNYRRVSRLKCGVCCIARPSSSTYERATLLHYALDYDCAGTKYDLTQSGIGGW